MKFAEHLTAHITPEWRKQYINYEEMKSLLYNSVEQAPSAEEVEPEVLSRYIAKFDESFFHYCESELTKINTFFAEKLAEAQRKFANLRAELSEIQEEYKTVNQKRVYFIRRPAVAKVHDLKLALSEFYLSLILLQNYQNLNFTGFRKILKKHDKMLNSSNGALYRHENIEMAHFYTNKDIDKLIEEVETIFTTELEKGDRQKAMKRLRVPPLGEERSPWVTFKVGLFSGAFVVLLIAVVISSIIKKEYDWRTAVRLYRGPLLIVENLFLLGVNVYGWRSSGVNHVLIFELDPRNHLSEQHIMEIAAIFGVIWTLSVLGFFYSSDLSIPPFANPLALVIIMIVFVFNPTKTFHHEARFWLLKVLLRIVLAPFFFVQFADFWLADQLTSLVPVFLDMHYLICFYATNWSTMGSAEDNVINTNACLDRFWIVRPILTMLPAWFRFAQCLRRFRDTREKFPHLANAGKYSTTFFVIIFSNLYNQSSNMGIYFYFWVTALFVSSIYAYIWDVRMDWGLLEPNAGENKFLREEIVYPVPVYYFIIVADLFFRFTWALSVSLTETGLVHSDMIVSIFAPIEVFRRFLWNYFRLENEHLNNCGKFRAVRDISVAPLDTSDQAQILRMMDEEDGVRNRHKKKVGTKKREHEKHEKRSLLHNDGGSDDDLILP